MSEPQGWIRHAIIRGDALSVGLWALMASAGLMLARLVVPGRLDAVGLTPIAAGLVAGSFLTVGVVVIRWHRVQYRRLLDGVRARFIDFDPGNSPVAWVSTEVWRLRNRFDPDLDPINELRSEVEPLSAGFLTESRAGAVTLPEMRVVEETEREMAPKDPRKTGETPKGGPSDLIEVLGSTPGRFIVAQPVWPVCCGALSQLVSLVDRDLAATALYLRRGGADGPDLFEDSSVDLLVDPSDAHTYRCSACGGMYATHPIW